MISRLSTLSGARRWAVRAIVLCIFVSALASALPAGVSSTTDVVLRAVAVAIAFVAVGAAAAVWRFGREVRTRVSAGTCIQCGHSRGPSVAPRCTECGAEWRAQRAMQDSIQSWSLIDRALASLVVLQCAILFVSLMGAAYATMWMRPEAVSIVLRMSWNSVVLVTALVGVFVLVSFMLKSGSRRVERGPGTAG